MAWIQTHTTKTGKTIYHVHFRDADGRHRSRSTKSSRLDTAEALKAVIERELDGEASAKAAPMTGLEAMERFLIWKGDGEGCAVSSVSMYRKALRPMFKRWESVPLEAWTCSLTKEYLQDKRTQKPRPWKNTAVRSWLVCCRMFEKWATANDVPVGAFTEGLKYPKKTRRAPRHLKMPDLRKLLEAARGHRLEVTVALAALAGMRRAETIAAMVEHVDFDAGTILVPARKGTFDRVVPLIPQLREILERRMPSIGALVVHGYAEGAEYEALAALCDEAGVPHTTFHPLRHSYASAVLGTGGTLVEVRDLLGHANIATTSIYLHSDHDGRKASVARFGDALKGA